MKLVKIGRTFWIRLPFLLVLSLSISFFLRIILNHFIARGTTYDFIRECIVGIAIVIPIVTNLMWIEAVNAEKAKSQLIES